MATVVVQLDKKFNSNKAMVKRLKVEINMLHRLKVSAAKVVHGGSQDVNLQESRLLCRQVLHELLSQGEIKAMCIGEHFGPFENDGQAVAALVPSLRTDPDWSRHDDSFVMIVL